MPIFADRVRDTTTTTGTGNITLAGAPPTGFRSFASAYAVGVYSIPYCIQDTTTGAWEVGNGTLTASTTFRRDQVTASSNANALVNFAAGTKEIFVTVPGVWATRQPSRGRVEAARLGLIFA